MNNLKIAFIKQDVYQDLYVCPSTEHDAYNVLMSTIMRVGPIGLMSDLHADFHIVKEEEDMECQVYRVIIPGNSYKFYQMVKSIPRDKIPGSRLKPGSDKPNGAYAVEAESVDWGQYDVVISVNVSLPYRVIKNYPQTLFCYMIGEANMAQDTVRFGYDVSLNQMARGIDHPVNGVIDMPYTFLGGETLQRMMEQHMGRKSLRKGAFMEINSTTERPVTKVPEHFRPMQEAGYEVVIHDQRIAQNLKNIFDAKYFVKMGGRKIRGNSVAEAVSLGTLALMDRDEVIHGELILDECNVKTMDELIAKMRQLDDDPQLYETLLRKQQTIVQQLFFDAPVRALEKALQEKRKAGKPKEYSWMDRFMDFLDIKKTLIHGKLYLLKKKFK